MRGKTISICKLSITVVTILPLFLLKVVNFIAIMTQIVTIVFLFMIVSFATFCAMIVTTKESVIFVIISK
jgi:hypothetical protein